MFFIINFDNDVMNFFMVSITLLCTGVKLGLSHWGRNMDTVFENREHTTNVGLKRDEVTREQRRLHNEELYDLSSPDVIWMIKSRRMRWAEHVERMGERFIQGLGW